MGATEGRGGPQGDEALITAVARGDTRASEGLYDRLAGVVDHALFRVFGRREPDHDDLVQATFEQIVTTLARQRFGRACNLPSLACSIATNVGVDALRTRRGSTHPPTARVPGAAGIGDMTGGLADAYPHHR